MDISQMYIEMCKAATEIQNISKTKPSDNWDYFWEMQIWLPRQDQLQAMLFGQSMESQMNTLRTFYHNPAVFSVKKTWEQLWLSIVMKQNYGKEYDLGKKQWIGSLW
jgi:hypothetical protein